MEFDPTDCRRPPVRLVAVLPCVQLADHIAYAVFRRYEAKDTNYFDVFAHRFDRVGSVIHGLRHIEAGVANSCLCPACLTRVASRPNGA